MNTQWETEYARWAQQYASAFFSDPKGEGLAAVMAWRTAFFANDYSIAELMSALSHLTINLPGAGDARKGKTIRTRKEDHLEAIVKHIQQLRFSQNPTRSPFSENNGLGTCVSCSGSGLIAVPHIEHVRDGRWVAPWYTFAVCCSCAMGNWRREHSCRTASDGSILRLGTIMQYENANPDWREQMDQRQQAVAEMREARRKTREMDARDVKLLARFGIPKADLKVVG